MVCSCTSVHVLEKYSLYIFNYIQIVSKKSFVRSVECINFTLLHSLLDILSPFFKFSFVTWFALEFLSTLCAGCG